MASKILPFISCLLFSCNLINSKPHLHVKPGSIPDGSFWIGGADGGNWFFVKDINSHRNAARIAVYNDQDGSLIVDTSFILICNAARSAFINDLQQQISAYDGDKIYFTKSGGIDCYLQPKN